VRYKILQKLGQGGMGEVYLAHDLTLERKVALKFMLAEAEQNAALRQRFLQEAKAAAAIDHPYVCKIYEVGEINGRAYIAMEYLEGETLANRMRDVPLPWNEARQIVIEISEALTKAHLIGIVHRDLKPSNVMVVSDGHVKVLDFGLAKRTFNLNDDTVTLASQTDDGKVVGTVRYMSPEQLLGHKIDARSDLFSLGIIFYELLAGVHPFRRTSIMATASAILHDVPGPVTLHNKECPQGIDRLLTRVLAKEPANRPQSIREFREDLLSGSDTILRIPAEAQLPRDSIAVLPFVNMSADPDQEYFSDGITEDLISQISKIRDLKVIARTSVMLFKNSTKELSVIGRDLGVRNIMEGSVRRLGDRVRITCALVDTVTSEQLWSEVYDRQLTDIFAIQSEVAAQIASALRHTLSGTLQRRAIEAPKNLEAYQIYLKARYFMNKATPDGIQKAIRYFSEALHVDPTNARAYAGLSTCYAVAGHWDFIPPGEAVPKTLAMAKRALELDSSLSEAYTSQGMAMMYEWDWQGCERNFRRAIELDSNSVDARVFYSWYLCIAGRPADALAQLQHAFELDPLSSFVTAMLAWVLVILGRFDEAIRRLEGILEIDPGFVMAYAELAHAYVGKAMYDEAFRAIEKGGWRKALYLIVSAVAGEHDKVRGLLEDLARSAAAQHERPSEIAYIYVLIGDEEKAAEWLQKAFEQRDYMIAMHTCGEWTPKRNDPLIKAYLERMGLTR
jgi:serine/threonine protein kinase/tetratricopeptide (TPR) repeat protein